MSFLDDWEGAMTDGLEDPNPGFFEPRVLAAAGRELFDEALSTSSDLAIAGLEREEREVQELGWRIPVGLDGRTALLHLREHAIGRGEVNFRLLRVIPHPDYLEDGPDTVPTLALVERSHKTVGPAKTTLWSYQTNGDNTLAELPEDFSFADQEARVPRALRLVGIVGVLGGDTCKLRAAGEALLAVAVPLGLIDSGAVAAALKAQIAANVRQSGDVLRERMGPGSGFDVESTARELSEGSLEEVEAIAQMSGVGLDVAPVFSLVERLLLESPELIHDGEDSDDSEDDGDGDDSDDSLEEWRRSMLAPL